MRVSVVNWRTTKDDIERTVRAVRTAGVKLPLTTALITAVTRQSQPAEDHLGRVRIADTLGLPRPVPSEPALPRTRVPRARSSVGPKVTWAAARILAAVGPLDLDTLLQAERSLLKTLVSVAGNHLPHRVPTSSPGRGS